MELEFLEDWLVAAASPSSLNPQGSLKKTQNPPPAARQITEIWGQLRACVQQGLLESPHVEALSVINQHCKSLHVAETQAKLLITLLTSVRCDNIGLLGQARAFSALVLTPWVRKTFVIVTARPSKQAEATLILLIESLCKAVQEFPVSDIYLCPAILLLGTVCSIPQIPDALKLTCQEVISRELCLRKHVIVQGEISLVLAGAGYAMVVANGFIKTSILQAVLSLWSHDDIGNYQARGLKYPPLREALMLFHLLEYQGIGFSKNKSIHAVAEIDAVVREIAEKALEVSSLSSSVSPATQCAAFMAAAGLQSGLNQNQRSYSTSTDPMEQELQRLTSSLNSTVIRVCEDAVRLSTRMDVFSGPREKKWEYCPLRDIGTMKALIQHKHRCIALAVARSRGLPPHSSILQCLLTALVTDILSLEDVYSAQMSDLHRPLSDLHQSGSALGIALGQLEIHVGSSLFLEVGAIARAMCEQYTSVHENVRRHTEICVWQFSQDVYRGHRDFTALSGKPLQQEIGALEKVLVSSFMMVLVFFSRAIGDARPVTETINSVDGEKAARALDSLSCVEFCRHVQMKDYGSLVERCVSFVAADSSATKAFASSLPPYNSVVQMPGPPELNNMAYDWSRDGVQTARLSFCLRVLPSLLAVLPEANFANDIAPLMFLYLQHPVEMVANAAHNLFAYFISLQPSQEQQYRAQNVGSDGLEITLREQLSIYYIRRAMEVEIAVVQTFPGATPFDALVFGVAAITKSLPPGSPATLHCIQLLVQKASMLKPGVSSMPQSANKGAKDADKLGDAEKIQLLLLHLIQHVDLQVLPELLKETAKLILDLPPPACTAALENAFEIVAGSSDYMRKPIVIPWIQSLAYLSSNPRALLGSSKKGSQMKSHQKQQDRPLPKEAELSLGNIVMNPSSGSVRHQNLQSNL